MSACPAGGEGPFFEGHLVEIQEKGSERMAGEAKGKRTAFRQRPRAPSGESRHEWVSDVGHGTACIHRGGRPNDLDSRGREA